MSAPWQPKAQLVGSASEQSYQDNWWPARICWLNLCYASSCEAFGSGREHIKHCRLWVACTALRAKRSCTDYNKGSKLFVREETCVSYSTVIVNNQICFCMWKFLREEQRTVTRRKKDKNAEGFINLFEKFKWKYANHRNATIHDDNLSLWHSLKGWSHWCGVGFVIWNISVLGKFSTFN